MKLVRSLHLTAFRTKFLLELTRAVYTQSRLFLQLSIHKDLIYVCHFQHRFLYITFFTFNKSIITLDQENFLRICFFYIICLLWWWIIGCLHQWTKLFGIFFRIELKISIKFKIFGIIYYSIIVFHNPR